MAEDSILDEIVQGVQEDGVYVAPALRQQVDATEEAEIEAAVARTDTPVYVVAVPLRDDDMFAGSAADLLTRVHDEIGGDGWYVAPSYIFSDGTYSLDTEQWASSYDTELDLPYDAYTVATELHPTDLGAGLVELTTAIADGTVPEKVAEANGTGTGSSTDDGPGAGVVVGSVSVVLALVVAVVLLRRRSRNLTGARQAVLPPSRRHYTLPESVLERVREADADRIAARSDRAVLALGERIDASEITAGGATDAWRAALDHYDAARRVGGADDESGRRDLLDDVGALVLAERGEAALDAALAGASYVPTTPCFLNPLHGEATAVRTIDSGDRTVKAPLCRQCRQALAAGRAPEMLDVLRDGKAIHYFDLDAEPWSSTGYGSLKPDLVERLHRSRRSGRSD